MARCGLTIVDRNVDGARHRHRWFPTCACGWRGVFRRRRRDAVAEHRDHVDALRRAARGRPVRRGRVRQPLQPRPVTPVDQLPEALR